MITNLRMDLFEALVITGGCVKCVLLITLGSKIFKMHFNSNLFMSNKD